MKLLELKALAAVLARQALPDDRTFVAPDRVRQALTLGPDFTDEELRILWSSQDARAILQAVRASVDRETRDSLETAGYGGVLRLRAASGAGEIEPIRGEGFVLSIFHDEDPEEWSLALRLEPELRKLLPRLATIKLVDEGGLTWLEGHPDSTGMLGGIWSATDTPIARLANYGLRLTT